MEEVNIKRKMNHFFKIKEIIKEIGFWECGYVRVDKLRYSQEVRRICEENTCQNYAASWACPPAIGTLLECRSRVEQYGKMLLFTKKYEVEDSFDFQGMMNGRVDFQKKVDVLQKKLNHILPEYLLLSNEGCERCAECTYPDAPCRFPQFLHHSLEGYGFIVGELAREAGVCYYNGPNTVTYFGALLFEKINKSTENT